MFQRQPRPFVNQVAMIQSRFQRPDNEFFESVRMPAGVFRRSPLRERFSGSNNPSRQGTPSRITQKQPSPVLSRRDSSMVNTKTFLSSQTQVIPQIKTSKVSRAAKQQPSPKLQSDTKYCLNNIHDLKTATYLVNSEDGGVPYCQKCAILLASQGFTVTKISATVSRATTERSQKEPAMDRVVQKSIQASCQHINLRNQALSRLQNTQRRCQLSLFLNDIKNISNQLKQRRQKVKSSIAVNKSSAKELERAVTAHISCLLELVASRGKEVATEIEAQRAVVMSESHEQLRQIESFVNDCNMMSDDIFSSIEVIRHVDDQAFRRVMQTYKLKSKSYIQMVNKDLPLEFSKSNVDVDGLKRASEQVGSLVKIRFLSAKKHVVETPEVKVYFSFNESRQEPTEELQAYENSPPRQLDEKFMKKFDDSVDSDF